MNRREKKKLANNLLLSIGVILIVCAIIFFGAVMIKIKGLTGQATSGSGTVSITVVAGNETQVGAPADSSLGGARGGGIEGGTSFDVVSSSYQVMLIEKSEEERELRVKNRGDITNEFTVYTNNEFIKVFPAEFSIRPGEEKIITIVVRSDKPGISVGRITVSSRFGGQKEIPVIINGISREVSFSLEVNIPEQFKVISPEGEILMDISLEGLKGGYVDMSYIIKDASNRGIFRENELLPVKESMSFQKTVKVPRELKPGSYVIGVQVNYKGQTKVASSFFTVAKDAPIKVEEPTAKKNNGALMLFVFIVILSGLHIFFARQKKEEVKF